MAEPAIKKKPRGRVSKTQPSKLRHEVDEHERADNFGGHRRARRKGELAIDWSILEREYVTGIIETDPKSGELKRIYPSLRELALRHRVKLPTVNYHSSRGNWIDRREKFVSQMKRELDEELAKARGLDTGRVLTMLGTYIQKFETAIRGDAIARGSIKDLEMALRLRAWVQRESEALDQPKTSLSLEALQARHKAMREREAEIDPALSGEIEGRTEREARAMREQAERSASESKADPEHEAAQDKEADEKTASEEKPRAKPGPKPKPKAKAVSAARLAAMAARRRAGLPAEPAVTVAAKSAHERKTRERAWEEVERRASELGAC